MFASTEHIVIAENMYKRLDNLRQRIVAQMKELRTSDAVVSFSQKNSSEMAMTFLNAAVANLDKCVLERDQKEAYWNPMLKDVFDNLVLAEKNLLTSILGD